MRSVTTTTITADVEKKGEVSTTQITVTERSEKEISPLITLGITFLLLLVISFQLTIITRSNQMQSNQNVERKHYTDR